MQPQDKRRAGQCCLAVLVYGLALHAVSVGALTQRAVEQLNRIAHPTRTQPLPQASPQRSWLPVYG